MTGQIGDSYFFDGHDYTIIAMSKEINFNPTDYGLIPQSMCTACWKGYWCEYVIEDGEIFLKNLHISCKDDSYPDLNGIKVKTNKDSFIEHHLYKNVNLPILYTGQIVVGSKFLNQYYIHMGYQRAWAYKTVLELVFEEGILLGTIDHSEKAENIREQIQFNKNFKKDLDKNISQFIEDSFSLDLKTKCWWLL